MTLLPESDLVAALAPLRPEPDAFRRAARAKLAEREYAVRPRERVAAVGPMQLLPQLFTGRGSTWLALPVVALVAVAATFLWASARILRLPTGRGPAQGPGPDELIRNWWSAHLAPAAWTFAALVVLAFTLPAAALLVVLTLSMVYVALVTKRVTFAGHATRATLGRLMSEFLGLLGSLLILAGYWSERASWNPHDQAGRVWVPATLIAGSFLCEWLGTWSSRRWPGRALGAIPLVSLVLVTALVLVPRTQPPVPEQIERWVEAFDEPASNTVAWSRFGTTAEWVLEAHNPMASLAPARDQLERALTVGDLPYSVERAAILARLLPAPAGTQGPQRREASDQAHALAWFRDALDGAPSNPQTRTARLHGGVQLLDRSPALDHVDLAMLRDALVVLATPSWIEALSPTWLPRLTIQPYRFEAAAALQRLKGSAAWRARTPAPAGQPWRSQVGLLAAFLLSALGALATLRGNSEAS